MNWKNMTLSHKIATIISVIVVLIWLIQKVKPGLFPIDVTYPAIAIFTVCEALVYWNNRRKWAYLLMAGAAVSIACFVWELML